MTDREIKMLIALAKIRHFAELSDDPKQTVEDYIEELGVKYEFEADEIEKAQRHYRINQEYP